MNKKITLCICALVLATSFMSFTKQVKSLEIPFTNVKPVANKIINAESIFKIKSMKNFKIEVDESNYINKYESFSYDIPQYTFKGYTIKDAHVIDYKGFRIVQPLNPGFNKQKFNAKQVSNAFKKLPNILAIGVIEIQLLDYSNIEDKYWSKAYNIKNFKSYAAGGGNKIYFYANNQCSTKANNKALLPTLAHESGHILDESSGNGYTRLSNTKEWSDIMLKDLILKDESEFGLYCSKYSKDSSSNVEDFAEAVSGYVTDKERFVKEYPNRSKKIEKLLNE